MNEGLELIFIIVFVVIGLVAKGLQKLGSFVQANQERTEGSHQSRSSQQRPQPATGPGRQQRREPVERQSPGQPRPVTVQQTDNGNRQSAPAQSRLANADSSGRGRRLSAEQEQQGRGGATWRADIGSSPDYYATEAVDTRAEGVDHDDVHENAYGTGREVGEESLQRAFPKAMQSMGEIRRGKRTRIMLNAHGRKRLRNAILMSEVISRPRAFDV